MDNNHIKQKNLSEYWMDFLKKEYEKETDRGAVVLTASLLENALTSILKKYLIPCTGSDDELFDSSNAPLSAFGPKIHLAYRLGIISSRMVRDLHIIRKMRNEFAHNVHGSNLESGKIKDLVTQLISSSEIVKGHEKVSFYPPGIRGDFLKIANIILFYLHSIVERQGIEHIITSQNEEWIYTWSYKEVTKPNVTSSS